MLAGGGVAHAERVLQLVLCKFHMLEADGDWMVMEMELSRASYICAHTCIYIYI